MVGGGGLVPACRAETERGCRARKGSVVRVCGGGVRGVLAGCVLGVEGAVGIGSVDAGRGACDWVEELVDGGTLVEVGFV